MFDHLFENRNTTVTNLLKLGDCLGRSLRENVELFSIDSEDQKVAYLTENGKVISGNYDCQEDLAFSNITIQDSEIFSDNEVFDSFVDRKVSYFVGDLNEDRYNDADGSFNELLSLWENRLKFQNVKKRLDEKSAVFGDSQDIVNTEQFQRFLEIMPQIVEFLEENRETVQKVQEVENSIKLSDSVSRAFNFPRLSFEALQESGSYRVAKGINKSVYDLVCKQELVKKELLESKKNFEDVWATNPHIRQLASLLFEDNDETVLESLVEAVVDVPFLALTTKRQLNESLTNAFSLTDHNAISAKDIKEFSSRIYEMKKPLKQIILNLLNEKYGINVQNLKETATFSSLANTQVVIFEALSRLAPKGSVVKSTLSEVALLLKKKNGVEVIDVNDVLQECFETCGYTSFCEDFTLAESISFEDILDENVNTQELLEKAKAKLLHDKAKVIEKDKLGIEQEKQKKKAEADEKDPASEADMEDDSVQKAQEGAAEFSKPAPFSTAGGGGGDDDDADSEEGGEEGPDEKTESKKKKKKVKEEAEEPVVPETEDSEEKAEPMKKEEFLEALKDMDELLAGMKGDEPEQESEDEDEDESQEG